MGQSYIDVYQAVQNIADEQERDKVTHQLANCSFWEESELSKQVSREVTLSQHAWSRIAYIKLQAPDQEMFAGLIGVARDVVHSPSSHPVAKPQPAIAPESPPPAPPEADSSSVAPAPPAPEPTEANITTLPGDSLGNSEPETTAVENPTEPDSSQPASSQTDPDPVEQAIQKLLSTAIASSTQVPPAGAPTLQWGRGSGRVTNADDASNHTNPELHRVFQRETLPDIA
ncbi:hypothetical protein C8255_13400 [filamentous cyanobacterium CCP3]|nr:hypothetical protein C8255_13400 [filamentous cyanobacterium CCP3]